MQPGNPEAHKIVDHLFRHETGKMVAVLTRLFGFGNYEIAEDIVQDTLLKALELWKYNRLPENPRAWLYKVAKNKAVDLIRKEKLHAQINSDLAVMLGSEYTLVPTVNEIFHAKEIKDNQLRMIFACCHPSIPADLQVTLTLKTLCGLSAKEIAGAFLTGEETISKRLYRAKEKIRAENIKLEYPLPAEMPARLESVLRSIYLLFNEGYNSSNSDELIRFELAEEAMRLNLMLIDNEFTNLPEANALMALMCFQASRFQSRLQDGSIVLLKDQDRSKWNYKLIEKGNAFLSEAARGETLHEYHIEAAIASCYASAPDYKDTNWELLLALFNQLLKIKPTPLVELNRAVVLAELVGPQQAIAALEKIEGLEDHCHYNAALGEMYLRLNQPGTARSYIEKAIRLTSSEVEKKLLRGKLEG